MLFTGESGEQYGYRDGWVEGVFEYSGEGQYGDMRWVRGNKSILGHAEDGKDLHLFEISGRAMVRYVGQMVCAGYKMREQPDLGGNPRQAIVFELVAVEGTHAEPGAAESAASLNGLWTIPMEELKALAANKPRSSNDPKVVKRNVFERSAAVRVYVLRRAGETCEGCGQPAPFVTFDGRPYLEPHHIRRRSDGGPDDPAWVAGVCPNCHRRAHHSKDADSFNMLLRRRLGT
jgi:5-methylcytosine-specific restriction protein A